MSNAEVQPTWLRRHGLTLFIVLAFGSIVAGLGQLWRLENTLVWSGSCPPTAIVEAWGLRVDCNGKNYDINHPSVVFSYVLNPGPLQCKVYANNQAHCEKRSFK